MNVVATWIGRAVDLLYPRNCQFCLNPLGDDERGVICELCAAGVKLIEPPFCRQCALPFAGKLAEPFRCGYCHDKRFHFERVVAACRAEGVVRESIHRFKYRGQMYFGEHLVGWLERAARRWLEWSEVDVVVPVPLHPRKHREREFNQAGYLADALGETFGVPVAARALRRVKDTVTQTALDAEARARNLHGAFAVADTAALAGKRVVLVDDVFTTGATLDACAKVVRVAGAERVIALTVARGI
jgi:ComF family protein